MFIISMANPKVSYGISHWLRMFIIAMANLKVSYGLWRCTFLLMRYSTKKQPPPIPDQWSNGGGITPLRILQSHFLPFSDVHNFNGQPWSISDYHVLQWLNGEISVDSKNVMFIISLCFLCKTCAAPSRLALNIE